MGCSCYRPHVSALAPICPPIHPPTYRSHIGDAGVAAWRKRHPLCSPQPTPNPTRCRFHISDAGVAAVAREARAKNVGARGLRSILEKALLDAMFHVSQKEGVVVCTAHGLKSFLDKALCCLPAL